MSNLASEFFEFLLGRDLLIKVLLNVIIQEKDGCLKGGNEPICFPTATLER